MKPNNLPRPFTGISRASKKKAKNQALAATVGEFHRFYAEKESNAA